MRNLCLSVCGHTESGEPIRVEIRKVSLGWKAKRDLKNCYQNQSRVRGALKRHQRDYNSQKVSVSTYSVRKPNLENLLNSYREEEVRLIINESGICA